MFGTYISILLCFLVALRLLQLLLTYADAQYSKNLSIMVLLPCCNKSHIILYYWMLISLLELDFDNHTSTFKTSIASGEKVPTGAQGNPTHQTRSLDFRAWRHYK